MTLNIEIFQVPDEAAVISLWQRCGLTRPWNDPAKDIARKLTTQPELFLVGRYGQQIVASVMAGFDGHRGWVNYLCVDPGFQRRRYAAQMMRSVEQRLLARGCPKINLQIRAGNDAVIAFYESLGYATDPVVSMGRRLIPDQ